MKFIESIPTRAVRGLFALLLLTTLLTACSKKGEKESTAPITQATDAPSSRVIKLDPKMQQQLQIKTEILTAVALNPEVKVSGRVLDPTPLAALATELTGAEAALFASEKEYARARLLLEQQNASVRVVQAAEAAALRDRSLVQSARDRIAFAWSAALAKKANLPALIQNLSSRKSQIVRLDIPLGDEWADPPTVARLVHIADETRSMTANFLGLASANDRDMQGQGLLYLAPNNSLHLMPGAAVIGYLVHRGEPIRGVRLPRPALIRHDALSWAYVQKDESSYERILVSTSQPLEGGWLVTTGLEAGDRAVTDGAQILLSEELKSQVHLAD